MGMIPTAVLLAAVALSACSSSGLLGSSQPDVASEAERTTEAPKPSSFRERMTALFMGTPAPAAHAETTAAAETLAVEDCPTIQIRSGASTYAVGPPGGGEPTSTTLRYQATVARTARECSVNAGNMTVKVGVQGRLILGPAGVPGQIEVPLRLALVQEGVEPKTLWTKGYRVPVTVPPQQTNVPFVHVEEDITFPVPKRNELDAYVVYIGFDPSLAKEPEKKPPPKKKPRASG
jgi:hypothetical protein